MRTMNRTHKTLRLAMMQMLWLPLIVLAQDPMSLSSATQTAVQQHPSLSAMRAEIDSSKAQGDMLQVPYKPMISLNGYTATGDGAMIFPGTVMPQNYALLPENEASTVNGMLMWRIFSGGRERTAHDIAKADVETAKQMYSSMELDVLTNVRLAFADALLKQEALEAQQAALENAKEVARTSQERYDAGKVPQAFLFRAQADEARAESAVAKAHAALSASVARLRETMGADQALELDLGEWDVDLESPATLEEALEIAHASRPILMAWSQKKRSFDLRGRLAEESNYPEVSIMAMGNVLDNDNVSGTRSKLGLIVSFPLVDGGERKAQRARSRAESTKAEASLMAQRLQVETQVAEAWAEWIAAPQVLQAAKAEVKAADESYRVALVRFEEGKAILVELTDARNALVQAQLALADANAYQRKAWSQLVRAMGLATN